MDFNTKERILQATDATDIKKTRLIQRLWNNYGELLRVYLKGGETQSVILKHIKIPSVHFHPTGFGTELSKQRKINSYRVETNWYENYNHINLADGGSPTARRLASFQKDGEIFILLEDLDALGYGRRLSRPGLGPTKLGLSWLASFHAKFLQSEHAGLWDNGTYWHLETRPDELEALRDPQLKLMAPLIDSRLKTAKHQTLVHGDAKLANFCFSQDLSRVAAVDFQYVGKGCGMKDVAYYIGSCLSEDQSEKLEADLLAFYFGELSRNVKDPGIDTAELEDEWRALYPVAMADFHRFMKGWSPLHWIGSSYSKKVTKRVMASMARELVEVAQTACVEAGKLVRSYWRTEFEISSKEGSTPSSSVVTEVDLLSQKTIVSILQAGMDAYDLGLLAEEDDDDKSRLEKEFFWAVDPLDGTLQFSEGKPGFAVTVALVHKTGAPIIGVVYDPVEGTLYHAVRGQGAFRDNRPIRLDKAGVDGGPIHAFVDRSMKHAPNLADLEKKFAIHFTGGAVMNAINVMLHRNACYFKYPKKEKGGCAIWDMAAVSLILEETGGVMTNINGDSLSFNNPETIYFNKEGFIACGNGKTFKKVKRLI